MNLPKRSIISLLIRVNVHARIVVPLLDVILISEGHMEEKTQEAHYGTRRMGY